MAYPNGSENIITGESKSRLSELKKHAVNSSFFNRYELSNGSSTNGVDKNKSNISTTPQKIVYYIDGIIYTDFVYESRTSTKFKFTGQGYNSPDFINKPIIKDPSKSNLISKPKVNSDVFIVRQEISAFEKNYKLKDIRDLNSLTTYAGGRFFNIVNNT
jgi:hypothetical protein